MNAEMIHTYQRMKRDLEAAARIQRSLLPAASPRIGGVHLAWELISCDELAGDSLNFIRLDDDHLGLYILDVSGHGLEAALLAVTVHKVLEAMTGARPFVSKNGGPPGPLVTPVELCTELNRIFPIDLENAQYFTLLYGIFDARARELRYVAAGHHAPIYLPPNGGAVEVAKYGLPIGVVADACYEEQSISMESGGRLYFYSDGLIDAECFYEGPFGKRRLLQTIEDRRHAPLSESVRYVTARVRDWSSTARLEDDASLLALEVM